MEHLIPLSNFYDDTLTDEELFAFQGKLWYMLARQTTYYTMGGSSSIPVETAQELYSSIIFTLAEGLQYGAFTRAQLLAAENLELFLKAGREEVDKQVDAGKQMWLQIEKHPTGIRNISYTDTIKGLVGFFKRYDTRYFAHQIPGDIDYQLCHAVPDERQGIEYVNEYLHRLLIENSFIRCFDTDTVVQLLHCYCPDYCGQLINLFDPVAVNAIGLALVKGDIYSLNMTPEMKQFLINRLRGCGKEKILLLLGSGADQVSSLLKADGTPASDYLRKTAAELVPRIEALLPTGKLDGLFLTLPLG